MCKENRGGPEAEFLAKIQTKALRVFLLAIYSHFYSFALRFFFQPTQPLKVSVKENGEYPLSYDLKKNLYINPQFEYSQDYASERSLQEK